MKKNKDSILAKYTKTLNNALKITNDTKSLSEDQISLVKATAESWNTRLRESKGEPLDEVKVHELVKEIYAVNDISSIPEIVFYDSPIACEDYLLSIKQSDYEDAEVLGTLNPGWMSFYESYALMGYDEAVPFFPMIELLKLASVVYFFESHVFVCRTPSAVSLQNNLIHAIDKPAIEFTDGTGYAVYNGIPVPARCVFGKKLTAQDVLDEKNQEYRRIMLEVIGSERFLETAKAKLIDKDKNPMIGELYRIKDPQGVEDLQILKVVNGTKEPEPRSGLYELTPGNFHKIYYLRVPPTCKTAIEAAASTYPSLTVDEYKNMMVRT